MLYDYLANKNFYLLISKENIDHFDKKVFLYEENVWGVHKILFKKLGFVLW